MDSGQRLQIFKSFAPYIGFHPTPLSDLIAERNPGAKSRYRGVNRLLPLKMESAKLLTTCKSGKEGNGADEAER